MASTLFARSVRLAASTEDGDGPKWCQVAEEGAFLGHPAGPFALDAMVFEEAIRNFRSHPAFEAGPDGLGCKRVVAWDFKHASEQPAAQLAVSGAPAQAWVLDLECRLGADGRAQLWALTEWLEPARTYVREGKYQWASIAIWPHSQHPVTKADIGWYISSVALTNDPFIQGMVPIAAERSAAPVRAARHPADPLVATVQSLTPAWAKP